MKMTSMKREWKAAATQKQHMHFWTAKIGGPSKTPKKPATRKVSGTGMAGTSNTKMETDLCNGCLSVTQTSFQGNDPVSWLGRKLHELHQRQLVHNQNGLHAEVKGDTCRDHRKMIVCCSCHGSNGFVHFEIGDIEVVLGCRNDVVVPRYPVSGKVDDVRVASEANRPSSRVDDLINAAVQLIQVEWGHDWIDDRLLERCARLELQRKTDLLRKDATRSIHNNHSDDNHQKKETEAKATPSAKPEQKAPIDHLGRCTGGGWRTTGRCNAACPLSKQRLDWTAMEKYDMQAWSKTATDRRSSGSYLWTTMYKYKPLISRLEHPPFLDKPKQLGTWDCDPRYQSELTCIYVYIHIERERRKTHHERKSCRGMPCI